MGDEIDRDASGPTTDRRSGHNGRVQMIGRMLSRRTNRVLIEIVDEIVGVDQGALQVKDRWSHGGLDATVERLLVYTTSGGKLLTCCVFEADMQVGHAEL